MFSTAEANVNITKFLAQVNGTYNDSNGGIAVELVREKDSVIIATFSNGVGCTFTKTAGILDFVLSLPRTFMGQTRGLLGNNNGDKTDEFIIRGTTHHLSDNISDADIFSFGKSCKYM